MTKILCGLFLTITFPLALSHVSAASLAGSSAPFEEGSLVTHLQKGLVLTAPSSSLTTVRSASELGDRDAIYEMGRMYARGVGVPMDLEKATQLFIRSAESGSKEAAFYLGFITDFIEETRNDNLPSISRNIPLNPIL